MNESLKLKLGKQLSHMLRHDPDSWKVSMDVNGWVAVSEVVSKLPIPKKYLEIIVVTNNKKRFEFSEDGSKIRACQGHSVQVNLDLKEEIPPEFLYHGTARKSIDSISKEGLLPMSRIHVHLSEDEETANIVGARHGSVVVIRIETHCMVRDGFKFYRSNNGVWLTNWVPSKYCRSWS